jgi:hypothetical protein
MAERRVETKKIGAIAGKNESPHPNGKVPKQPPVDVEEQLRGSRGKKKGITIDKDEIIRLSRGVKLSPTQQIGVWLLWGIGIVIFLIIVAILIDWFINAPHLAMPSSVGSNSDTIKQWLDTQRTLNDLSLNRATSLFDLFVIRTLLPIFATILGFIFGRQTEKRSDNNSD